MTDSVRRESVVARTPHPDLCDSQLYQEVISKSMLNSKCLNLPEKLPLKLDA